MTWLKTILLLSLTAQTPLTREQHEGLMDQIDRAVVLPNGARPLNEYGRNFAFSRENQVKIVYFLPYAPPGADWSCVDGDLKPCSDKQNRRSFADGVDLASRYAFAGKRRWFDSEMKLPAYADGGCAIVTARYDLIAKSVVSVDCNGR